MFRCERCGKISEPREQSVKVVIASRPVEYKGGYRGFETVTELLVCRTCATEEQGKE
jgi:hypothetical protein